MPTATKCPSCPVSEGNCLGQSVPRLCHLAGIREDFRLLLIERALGGEPAPAPIVPDALGLVSACPHRGPVLPLRHQPECGCAELSECRDGRGGTPGRVTLRECLACVGSTRGRA